MILEPFFLCRLHGGLDWDTYYNWPVAYKDWFLKRLAKEAEKNNNLETAPGNETPMRKINFANLEKAFGGKGDR